METEKLKFKKGDYVWFEYDIWANEELDGTMVMAKIVKVDYCDIELPYLLIYKDEEGYNDSDWTDEDYVYEATDEEVFLWKLRN